MWNLFDIALLTSYIAFAMIDLFTDDTTLTTCLECAILLLIFVKVNFYLRIFEGFSFMVTMMQGVFKDLKYFMGFFAITVIEFGMLFTVLI